METYRDYEAKRGDSSCPFKNGGVCGIYCQLNHGDEVDSLCTFQMQTSLLNGQNAIFKTIAEHLASINKVLEFIADNR